MEQVVWVKGQKVHWFAAAYEAAGALVFHYKRVLFGAHYGMG
jgi:hypothetical protein